MTFWQFAAENPLTACILALIGAMATLFLGFGWEPLVKITHQNAVEISKDELKKMVKVTMEKLRAEEGQED